MVKQQIIQKITERTTLNDYEARMAVDATIQILTAALKNGEDVTLRGFGSFKIKKRGPKSVRDINNGLQYTIAAKKRVTFKPGIDLDNI